MIQELKKENNNKKMLDEFQPTCQKDEVLENCQFSLRDLLSIGDIFIVITRKEEANKCPDNHILMT